MVNRQVLCIFVVVVAICVTPALSGWDIGERIKNFLSRHQEQITDKVAAITIKGECGRNKNLPEYVKGDCHPVTDVLKGKFDPHDVSGKWYGVLQSSDILKQGKPETLKANRECVSYDIEPTPRGLVMTQTSFSDANGNSGREVSEATLTQTKDGTATFKMEGSETGFDFAQVTAAKADDYSIWFFTRNNGNSTCTMKMACLSRTPNITTDSLLAFHEVVLLKNFKTLNIHPRLFHINQDTCPRL